MIDNDKINDILWKSDNDKQNHFEVMCRMLESLNYSSHDFILKGGTALMVCYGLDRFSEDIDLDSTNKNIEKYVDDFCKANNYMYRKAKDTNTTKRFQIHHSENMKPLKVEILYRQKQIDETKTEILNGVCVYKINELFGMKMNAYNSRDKIRDLYDVVYIMKNFKERISLEKLDMFKDVLSYKGLEQFDYLIKTQKDELINNEKLASDFLDVFDKLDLLDDYEIKYEKELPVAHIQDEIFNAKKQVITKLENSQSKTLHNTHKKDKER
ncbi:MAG: nucleotidyl transferase AbiEii/AbiGii toxin family protein [Longicatena sp.]